MTMTTRPTSHLIHSGFLDILSLIPEGQSQSGVQVQSPPRAGDDLRQILKDDARSPKKARLPPTPSKVKKEKRSSVELRLRKRKVDKGMIGPPMDFRYVFRYLPSDNKTDYQTCIPRKYI
jgi:hypothetical protein